MLVYFLPGFFSMLKFYVFHLINCTYYVIIHCNQHAYCKEFTYRNNKRKSTSPERKIGEVICAICTYWSALPSICSRVAQRAPFLKKLIEAGVW